MTDKVYSTSLTGAGFRFYEFKVTVSLIEEGLTDEEKKEQQEKPQECHQERYLDSHRVHRSLWLVASHIPYHKR